MGRRNFRIGKNTIEGITMRYIQKGKPPESLIQYAKNKDAYFDGFPDKNDIREQLLKDQGYLCGYCMKRLRAASEVKIEHILPQSKLKDDPRRALDYKIMLGVCYGNEQKNSIGKKRYFQELTCDAHRKNIDLKKANPHNQLCIDKIRYEVDGRITSDDLELKNDLEKTLNLNYNGEASYLMENRKAVLVACKEKMKRMKQRGQWNKAFLQRILKEYEEPDESGHLKPYSGIAIWYLKKRIEGK